jgi:hypothetical protein
MLHFASPRRRMETIFTATYRVGSTFSKFLVHGRTFLEGSFRTVWDKEGTLGKE